MQRSAEDIFQELVGHKQEMAGEGPRVSMGSQSVDMSQYPWHFVKRQKTGKTRCGISFTHRKWAGKWEPINADTKELLRIDDRADRVNCEQCISAMP